MRKTLAIWLPVLLTLSCAAAAQPPLAPAQGDFVIKNFKFASGEVLPEVRLHYRTLGKPQRDASGRVTNAVLIIHGTTGTGAYFAANPYFGGQLFVPGGVLDANRYFLIMPDVLGHGQSSKPSDGLRAHFPRYGYNDMVEAQYRLLTEGMRVDHLRLVMGLSMGAMHTWIWAERYPDFMDALMPLGGLPTQVSGRNRVWRRIISDAIRNDPEWKGGNYTTQPQSLRTAEQMIFFITANPIIRQRQMPTLDESDAVLDTYVMNGMQYSDANDVLYSIESCFDYDPGPHLEKIKAPIFAVNSADDLINPPELGILEREIKRVPKGRAIMIPAGPQTQGHGTHSVAALWKGYLQELLTISEK